MKIANAVHLPTVFSSVVLLFLAAPLLAAENSLQERIERLEEHLFAINAQLGKLEVVQKSLEAIREDDLVRLRQLMRPGTALAKQTQSPKAADENQAARPLVDAPSQAAVDQPPEAAQDGSLEERTTALEKLVAKIQTRYALIDTIAEQLHLLRHEDLAGLSRDARGLTETMKKVPREPRGDRSVVVPSLPTGPQGTLIINNSTAASYRVAINGRTQLVPPGRTTLEVPYGPVRTRLVDFGEELSWPLTQWKKVDDEYRLTLDLKN